MNGVVVYRAEVTLIEAAVAMASFRAAWPAASPGGSVLVGVTPDPKTYWVYFEPLPSVDVQFHLGFYVRQAEQDLLTGIRQSDGMITIATHEPWIFSLLLKQMDLHNLNWQCFSGAPPEPEP